jgi:pre-mRNA-splicing factor CWC22
MGSRSRTRSESRSRTRSRTSSRSFSRSRSRSSSSSSSSNSSSISSAKSSASENKRSRNLKRRHDSVSSSDSHSKSPKHRKYNSKHHTRSRRHSRSKSLEEPHKDDIPKIVDIDPERKREREIQLRMQANIKPDKNKETATSIAIKKGRTGGMYIPPGRLKLMQEQIEDKSSEAYQRMSWEALKKSINGLINKVNTSNIKNIIPELFSENLIRGRGLLCRSVMKAQVASSTFTNVYAAMIAVINTKFPQIGELLLTRLIVQFKRAYRRNNKQACLSSTFFIAHLVNQRVAHEIIALQILTLLLERPTNDSVEVAIGFIRECGALLADVSAKANNAIFERFRSILHEGQIDKRTQYMVEVLFQVRRDKYKDNPTIVPELDLVEEEDQITHYLSLNDDLDTNEMLNVFQFDKEFLENEEK